VMGGRARYIRNRLVLAIFVLFGVTIVIFGMVHFLPGDPAAILLGDRATVQNVADLRDQLGLNRSLPEQYWLFVSGLVRGQMGTSMMFRQPVNELVLSRVPISIGLAVYAMALAAAFTLVFALLAAANKGRWVDQVIRVVFLLVLTTPNFWLGILLILVLSLALKWFPVAGFGETPQEHIWYLFLPAFTLALQFAAVLIRNLRSQVILTMRSDFVRTARAKGVTEQLVLVRHVLRNALLSTITIFGLQFGFLVGGTLVIETVFAVPGMGQLLFTSITSRDYPVVQAITVVSAVLVILVNLVVDVSYSFLDPRVTYD
jgi:peptide/nickel transport system permease protein